jgi:hypothetical protein
MKAKFLTEALFLIILTLIFQFFIIEALDSGHVLLKAYESVKDEHGTQAAIDAALEEHHDDAIKFMEDMAVTEYLSIMSFFFPVRIILEMLFAVKTNRTLRFVTFTNLLDTTFAICFGIRLVKEYAAYDAHLDEYSTEGHKAIRYFENIYEYEDDEIMLDILYSVAIGALWVRILYMFRLTKFLGPLLNMIYMMIWDIMIFMVLFGILLVIYASVGNLLYYDQDSFSDFWTSIVTLFGSALGNFDLNLLDASNKGKLTGELYTISFVVLCNILVLNLLIAILSTTYANLEEKKLVLYINEILRLRQSLEYHPLASGLISAPPPWNVFPLLLSPLYFFFPNTTTLDNVICHI